MARIVEYRSIRLDDLSIGKGQARVQDRGTGIDELADSIRVQGLLQPIVVCQAKNKGKWEILTGQRRFLAHKQLRMDEIAAAVLDKRVSDEEAKVISVTENLMRRKLSGKELTDAVTYLYKHYGTQKAVVDATGIPKEAVQVHVKYWRLIPELKKMVDDGAVDIKVALRAQDTAESFGNGELDTATAVTLAEEMSPMTKVQRDKLANNIKTSGCKKMDEAIESAKTGSQVVQIIATVTSSTHAAIKKVAQEENSNQDEATVTLIEEALVDRGLLAEE